MRNYTIIFSLLATIMLLLSSCFKEQSNRVFPYTLYPQFIHLNTLVDSSAPNFVRLKTEFMPFKFNYKTEKFEYAEQLDSIYIDPYGTNIIGSKLLSLTNNSGATGSSDLSLCILFDYSDNSPIYSNTTIESVLHLYSQLNGSKEVMIAAHSTTNSDVLTVFGRGFYEKYDEAQIADFIASDKIHGGTENLITGIDSAIEYITANAKYTNKQLVVISNKPYLINSYAKANAIGQHANAENIVVNFKNYEYSTNINQWFFYVQQLVKSNEGLYIESDLNTIIGNAISIFKPQRQSAVATIEIKHAQPYYNTNFTYYHYAGVVFSDYTNAKEENFFKPVFKIP